MQQLFSQYSTNEIIIFVVLLASAVKGFISFWDWSQERLKKAFSKENEQKAETQTLQNKIQSNSESYQELRDNQKQLEKQLSTLVDKINLLIASDKDAIKAYITERFHHFYDGQKWIDDYSLNCIERRYEHYLKEGGNSFIEELMNELRSLPKRPPE